MQGIDLLLPTPEPRVSEKPRDDRPRDLPRPRERRYGWALDTPELRYAVASLEHWLDLNG
jgi:hypothetical protein